MRGKFASLSDDEMTNVIPSKSIGEALESARAASPRPAAGMPPAPASSGRTQLRESPNSSRAPGKLGGAASSRSGKFVAQDDEEEDGRTVVRGAPKIVKRAPSSHRDVGAARMGGNTMPTTISPAAVIKATLESAKAAKRGDRLMAPPPTDLLEDLADLHPADGPAENTKILQSQPPAAHATVQQLQPQGMQPGSLPPSSVRPMSNPPPSMRGDMANGSGGYPQGSPAQQSGPWAAQYNNASVNSGSVSVPGVAIAAPPASMPAHFMVPNPPYSDARIDPPGTAVTARTKAAGRPAMSWAVALMAFGLFVGVGAFAVMKGNNGDGVMSTGAAFVDPARAAQPAAGGAAPGAQPVAAPQAAADPNVVSAPGVAVPAAPVVAAAPVAVAPTTPGVAPTVAGAPVAAPAAVAPAAVAPAAVPAAATAAPAVVAAVAPAPAPAPRRRVSAPSRPAQEEAPAPAAPAPAAPAPKAVAKGGKAAGGKTPAAGDPSVDEEQKKALKALQESQLESTF